MTDECTLLIFNPTGSHKRVIEIDLPDDYV
jgi:hypothetical protein